MEKIVLEKDLLLLEDILSLEEKRGFKNDAALNGFSNFFLKKLETIFSPSNKSETTKYFINSLKETFIDYDLFDENKRREKIRLGFFLLDELRKTLSNRIAKKEDSKEAKKNDKSTSSSLLNLNKDIQYLEGVGPKFKKVFQKIGIDTFYDLLYYFPKSYWDRSKIKNINELNDGEIPTIRGKIIRFEKPRARIKLLKAYVKDDNNSLIQIIWFNSPYLEKTLPLNAPILFSGKVTSSYTGWEMIHPVYEIEEEGKETIHTGRIVPKYSLTASISDKVIRNRIKSLIDNYASNLHEYLPAYYLKKYDLPFLNSALKDIHFPKSFEDLERARKRLLFDELFLFELLIMEKKFSRKKKKGIPFKINENYLKNFNSLLPFKLTESQEIAIEDIKRDIVSPIAMNRLIHGDVGSGKTIVSMFPIYVSYINGYQSVFMAPTEILSQQVYYNISNVLKNSGIKVKLLTSGTSKKEKQFILKEVMENRVDVLVGTHALIQDGVYFGNLGLVVVDEQHRFGVEQRARLLKKGINPHTLVMSATPIPRTLALTLYGDLDITQINELPSGRIPIITRMFIKEEKIEAYKLLKEELKKKRQAYVVCPAIEEDEELNIKAAESLFNELKSGVLKDFKLALIHGKLKDKDSIMQEYKEGLIDCLVSTTVVEVGIDVLNATVMLIEDASRFGLATLHQLRGRVGRSNLQSYCFLVVQNPSSESIKRLSILLKTNNGFVIAEEDLKLRGPGDLFGTLQHGFDIQTFKGFNIFKMSDISYLEVAKNEAELLLMNDPGLKNEKNKPILDVLLMKYKNNVKFIGVG